MNYNETEDQRAIRATVREFAVKEILPHRLEWDETQYFPRELFARMGELGLMGMLVPANYGGSGLGYFEYKAAIDSAKGASEYEHAGKYRVIYSVF